MSEYDPLDEDARKARREDRELREREERSQEQVDIGLLMDEPHGRRIAYRLLDTAGCFRMSHTTGDPYETAFKEGCRNVGNWLLAQLMKETPEQYAQMLKENSDAR